MELKPEQYFWLKDGVYLKSKSELAMALKKMPQDIFLHHVTPEKNDFSNWLRHVFGEKELAEKIENIKSSDEMYDIIERYSQKDKRQSKAVKSHAPSTKKEAPRAKKVIVSPLNQKKKVVYKNKKRLSKPKPQLEVIKQKTKVTQKPKPQRPKKIVLGKWYDSLFNRKLPINSINVEFSSSLIDFTLGVAVGMLIAIILSKVL